MEVLTLGLLLAYLSYPVRQEGLKSLRERGEVSQDFRGECRGGRSLFESPAFRVCVDQREKRRKVAFYNKYDVKKVKLVSHAHVLSL